MILVCNSNIKKLKAKIYDSIRENASTRKPVEILIIIAINLSGKPSNKASIKDND
jgi:hypothetical protein